MIKKTLSLSISQQRRRSIVFCYPCAMPIVFLRVLAGYLRPNRRCSIFSECVNSLALISAILHSSIFKRLVTIGRYNNRKEKHDKNETIIELTCFELQQEEKSRQKLLGVLELKIEMFNNSTIETIVCVNLHDYARTFNSCQLFS